MKTKLMIPTLLIITAFSLFSCYRDDSGYIPPIPPGEDDLNLPPLDPQLVQEGQQVFRYDTFGDETFWTDVLQMNKVIETAVDPTTALTVAGLKVDATAIPAAVVAGIKDGSISLTDPQTTLALISLDAVLGVKGTVSTGADGKLKLDRMGITCALCHSTVDDSFAPGIGNRLDGHPNRDLNPGLIISLSPALDDATRAVYASWKPGFYDPRFDHDGLNNPVVIPAAYGLYGLPKSTFTGDGDVEHEPAGPVAYWNRFVAVNEMHGHGFFEDTRLNMLNDYREGDDLVTDKLPALQAYQYSISAPTPPADSFNATAAVRGKELFSGKGKCATCHSGPLFTDVIDGGKLHPQSASVAVDKDYVNRSATKQWRVTPLKGVWQHPPYFHDGSAETLTDVVARYNQVGKLGLSTAEQGDLTEYLKSL